MSDYERDMRTMRGLDCDQLGAACGAGAVSYETVQEAYHEMRVTLWRIRQYEREHNLPASQWHYDGTKR